MLGVSTILIFDFGIVPTVWDGFFNFIFNTQNHKRVGEKGWCDTIPLVTFYTAVYNQYFRTMGFHMKR
jgi:hypothetical protein